MTHLVMFLVITLAVAVGVCLGTLTYTAIATTDIMQDWTYNVSMRTLSRKCDWFKKDEEE